MRQPFVDFGHSPPDVRQHHRAPFPRVVFATARFGVGRKTHHIALGAGDGARQRQLEARGRHNGFGDVLAKRFPALKEEERRNTPPPLRPTRWSSANRRPIQRCCRRPRVVMLNAMMILWKSSENAWTIDSGDGVKAGGLRRQVRQFGRLARTGKIQHRKGVQQRNGRAEILNGAFFHQARGVTGQHIVATLHALFKHRHGG